MDITQLLSTPVSTLTLIAVIVLVGERLITGGWLRIGKNWGHEHLVQNSVNDGQEEVNARLQKQLDVHTASLKVANHEMGHIQKDIATIKNDVGWIKKALDKK